MAKHKDEIENVQRRATTQLPGMSNLSYPERLQKLKLPILAYRRILLIRGDMIELFKILTGKYDPEVSDFIQLKGESFTRGHTCNYKIFKIRPRLNIRKYSFIHRSVDTWNNLPESVMTAKNIVTFESRLDRLWKDQPLYYNYKECIQNYPTGHGHEHDISRDSSFEMTVEDPVES